MVGYLRGPRPDGMDCDRPLQLVCRHCPSSSVMRCKNHRASRCKSCSTHYRNRVRRVASQGMLERCHVGVQGMLTLTAPSEDEHDQWVIGWDRKTPRPRCGCHGEMVHGIGFWNGTASQRWNRLRTYLAREYPGMQFLRTVELQQRGALHLHVITWTPNGLDLQRVQALALSAGFGCSVDWKQAAPGDTRQAAYVSKYVTKATDQREETPWDVLDLATGEVREVVEAKYRTWSSSQGWGCTMKAVEAGIREAARRRAAHLLTLAPADPSPAPDAAATPSSGVDPPP